MIREDILTKLRAFQPQLRRFGVVRLRLFGSFARGSAGPLSDVDLLADFESGRTPDFVGLMQLEDALAEHLGRRVEITTPRGLHPLIAEEVLAQAIDAA